LCPDISFRVTFSLAHVGLGSREHDKGGYKLVLPTDRSVLPFEVANFDKDLGVRDLRERMCFIFAKARYTGVTDCCFPKAYAPDCRMPFSTWGSVPRLTYDIPRTKASSVRYGPATVSVKPGGMLVRDY
jgi:hypothetical protein